ncbi:MAG: hypothetical protein Q9180_000564 [Flavoplaca navasiana]
MPGTRHGLNNSTGTMFRDAAEARARVLTKVSDKMEAMVVLVQLKPSPTYSFDIAARTSAAMVAGTVEEGTPRVDGSNSAEWLSPTMLAGVFMLCVRNVNLLTWAEDARSMTMCDAAWDAFDGEICHETLNVNGYVVLDEERFPSERNDRSHIKR